jgi:predicted transcriptional regulator
MAQETGTVTVRIPVKTQKKLDQIASEADRSRNWIINEAIAQYLDVYALQEQRIRERLKKAEKGGKFLAKAQVGDVIESFKP